MTGSTTYIRNLQQEKMTRLSRICTAYQQTARCKILSLNMRSTCNTLQWSGCYKCVNYNHNRYFIELCDTVPNVHHPKVWNSDLGFGLGVKIRVRNKVMVKVWFVSTA